MDTLTPIADVKYSLTIKEMWMATMQLILQRRWYFFVIAAGVTILFFATMGTDTVYVAGACVYWIFLISYMVLRPLSILSNKKTKALIERERRLIIDRERMSVYIGDELRSVAKLDELFKILRVRDFWILYATKAIYYPIPRRVFTSEQEALLVDTFKVHHLM